MQTHALTHTRGYLYICGYMFIYMFTHTSTEGAAHHTSPPTTSTPIIQTIENPPPLPSSRSRCRKHTNLNVHTGSIFWNLLYLTNVLHVLYLVQLMFSQRTRVICVDRGASP